MKYGCDVLLYLQCVFEKLLISTGTMDHIHLIYQTLKIDLRFLNSRELKIKLSPYVRFCHWTTVIIRWSVMWALLLSYIERLAPKPLIIILTPPPKKKMSICLHPLFSLWLKRNSRNNLLESNTEGFIEKPTLPEQFLQCYLYLE